MLTLELKLYFMQQQSELLTPSKSLKFTYSSRHMKHKIIPPFLPLKLLYNLRHQHNFSKSMGLNGISL